MAFLYGRTGDLAFRGLIRKYILHPRVTYSPQLGKRREQKGQGMEKGTRDLI